MAARNYCFTLNNYTEEEHQQIQDIDCSYLIIGKEVGENKATPHLQGYIEFKFPKKLGALKKINTRVHWEPRKGTAEQAADYCKKEGVFIEKGERSKQGKRSDLEEVVKIIDKPLREIAEQCPIQMIKYIRGIEAVKALRVKERTEKPIVHWYWGDTGTGKTRTAREIASSCFMKDSTKWWGMYAQEEAIIIDDFDGWWDQRDFLRLLDRYPYTGEVKGCHVTINSKYIIITSEFAPDMMGWRDSYLQQVMRRIDVIKHFERSGTEVSGTEVNRVILTCSPNM